MYYSGVFANFNRNFRFYIYNLFGKTRLQSVTSGKHTYYKPITCNTYYFRLFSSYIFQYVHRARVLVTWRHYSASVLLCHAVYTRAGVLAVVLIFAAIHSSLARAWVITLAPVHLIYFNFLYNYHLKFSRV